MRPRRPVMTYSFAVPNGTYQVRLHFAENYAPNFGVGLRVFDVQVEGALAIDNRASGRRWGPTRR